MSSQIKEKPELIQITNRNQSITWTNYWDSANAQAGYFFLSWNAGAGRILVPDCQKPFLREVRSAHTVIVSRGPWHAQGGRDAIELLFEDDSDSPFSIQLAAEQCDRLIPDYEEGGGFVITAWTRKGLKQRWPAKYRQVNQVPDLSPWS